MVNKTEALNEKRVLPDETKTKESFVGGENPSEEK